MTPFGTMLFEAFSPPGARAGEALAPHIAQLEPLAATRPHLRRSPPMARYFFHIENGRSVVDDVGVELDDPHEARAEAVRRLGDILREDPHHFWDLQSFKLIVTDADHLILFVLDLSGMVAPAMSIANRA